MNLQLATYQPRRHGVKNPSNTNRAAATDGRMATGASHPAAKKGRFCPLYRPTVTRALSACPALMVLDNLNTHFAKAFHEVLGAKRAEKILCRLVFHYTPKHASWLNMAEIEIGILEKQCLHGRIASAEELITQIDAWQARRNQHRSTINWTFTRIQADQKLGRIYVA
jgi:hypothetical protein